MVGAKPFIEESRDGAGAAPQPDELRQLKGQFLASLNHEIRTPLSGILGMMDLLLETPLNEEQQEYITATRLCAQNLSETLNAALEFSALSAGTESSDESTFDLPETLRAPVLDQILQAEAKGLKLYCTLDENLPRLAVGDAVQIRKLLAHLLSNALKFTPRGEVEIEAKAGPHALPAWFELTVSVRDTGIGIPGDKVSAIFESFSQVESGLARGYPGLGLGLALAQKLTDLLGGTLSVESEVTRGSTFTFRIPLRLVDRGATESQRIKSKASRILVVEDHPVAQTIVKHILSGRGKYQTDCVSTGAAAIEAARRTVYDLILMDLQMPGMSGIEATAAIRMLPGYEMVPIVAFTANSSSEFRELCRESGMQGFLAKPVQPDEMLATVSRLIK